MRRVFIAAAMTLAFSASAHAELLRVEITTLGMD
jgi:hypothetical protein